MTGELTFVLVPDADAGRRLRRHLVAIAPRIGVRVGTWLELLSEIRNAYLIHEARGWEEALDSVLASSKAAFWARSYQVDPNGVAAAVESAWRMILTAQTPQSAWPTCSDQPRIAQRLADLNVLNSIDRHCWPDDLSTIAQLFESRLEPVRRITVRAKEWDGLLTPWQREAIDYVNRHSGPIDSELEEILVTFEGEIGKARAKDGSRLRYVQEHLGSNKAGWSEADGSCELVAVRDELECIEIGLGMIQQRMSDNTSLRPSDFGIIIPQGYPLVGRLEHLASQCGLPLSNLPNELIERDVAHELLRFALTCFEGFSPSMAIQALVSNPLMPWPQESGLMLANTLKEYGFRLKLERLDSAAHRELAKLFENPMPVSQVGEALAKLLTNLNADPALEVHRQRAAASGQRLIEAIAQGERDWDRLRGIVPPQNLAVASDKVVNQEGVCVIGEGRTPLRPVKHLLVLSFCADHYPAVAMPSVVFSPGEWGTLKGSGLPLQLTAQSSDAARRIFRRQLAHARESATMFIPKLSASGKAMGPSVSLMDFALLAGCTENPDRLLLDIEREQDRQKITCLAKAAAKPTVTPKSIEAQDLDLGVNLLAPYETTADKPRTLSPTALDNLLVSPLAWLLKQLGAEPTDWAPDQFDPMTSGSIAHEVFEALFEAGSFEPSPADLQRKVNDAYEQGLRRISPFLAAPEWAVERNHLRGIVERAVESWALTLGQLKAHLIQPEIALKGEFDGVAIAGKADAVLDVPDVGAVVVDYKNSRSKKFVSRMEATLDLQTVLYREMLRTGGAKHADSEAAQRLSALQANGVMYFAMQDCLSVADFEAPSILGNWRFAGRDVSAEGLRRLRERFAELRKGEIRAPRVHDIKVFKSADIRPYALELSPLTAPTLDDSEVSA